MFDLFGTIEEWIRGLLTGFVSSNLTTMFADVNEKTGTIASEVGQTPQGWNTGIFSMIHNLSDSVVVPIAGLIITFVLCYELISMIIEKNNMHDMDTWMFFKWFFKAFVAVFLVTNTFNIVMAIFDVGQSMVNSAAGVIGGSTAIDIAQTITAMETEMATMGIGELLSLTLETALVSLCMKIISILITVVLYGRMIEIYLYSSVAPVPFATMTNREWGQIGNNYARGLLALGFQGFFIMVIVGIYCVLVNEMTVAANIHSALFSIAAYTVVLCFALFKTGSISKSIFNAH
ncbi:VirB6/TrbL-like conjugal transfer protein, CD1112 family [Fusibacillus kribbianus]|uniref:CD0415/CD1112 family protein n=1 Tax=Fusibacillus kribbianus TaxID=3044208 RepID=A0AAP4BDE1_9FIRM|nr:CD0415/CD1112 family protein [Ruminococcus sp. YH-rum2234]MDI9243278.1 CD0415/CD1112 family protein [Ruminococcus sp. YH-rum2234]